MKDDLLINRIRDGDIACDFSAKFQSVVGTGKISIVEDREEKLKGLNFLMRQTSGNAEW